MRVDAASKVQLLLMTKSRPEIFKLKFKNHIECERWESAILSAVEICKKEGFTCGESALCYVAWQSCDGHVTVM